MTDGAALIWSPFGDEQAAMAVAEQLLAEELIACANILPGVTSVFRWKGEMASEREVGVLFKTTASSLQAAVDRLAELHPYDTPAIAGWVAGTVPETTMDWLKTSIGK